MNANQEIIAELRRVLGERDAAREQLDLTKRELGRWVDRETQSARERDELRAQRGLALGRLENAIQLANQYAKERDQEREACAMYAERSGMFAEQVDKLQADLDDCRARSADMRTMLERVTRERDLALGRLENESKVANQARMAEERARESLDELDAAIYECLPSDYDDDSPLDCVEHAADRLRELAEKRDEARAEVERLRIALLEVQTSESAPAWFADGFHEGWKAGAEAMREACAQRCCGTTDWFAAELRALPIPEEP